MRHGGAPSLLALSLPRLRLPLRRRGGKRLLPPCECREEALQQSLYPPATTDLLDRNRGYDRGVTLLQRIAEGYGEKKSAEAITINRPRSGRLRRARPPSRTLPGGAPRGGALCASLTAGCARRVGKPWRGRGTAEERSPRGGSGSGPGRGNNRSRYGSGGPAPTPIARRKSILSLANRFVPCWPPSHRARDGVRRCLTRKCGARGSFTPGSVE